MMIYEALRHMRTGKIARCKRSLYAIDEDGNIVRVHKKQLTIQGIAVIDGTLFATDKWQCINNFPVKEKKYGFHNSEI